MARKKDATEPPYVEAIGGNAAAQLRALIERIERLAEERAAIGDDMKEVFAEAKGGGFDPKIMRILIRRRAMDAAARAEQDAMLDVYSHAVGTDSPADSEPGTDS